METRAKIVLLLNLIFVALLLFWPLLTAPKFKISLEEGTVPLGGALRFSLSFSGTPSSIRLDVVDLERNITIESRNLQPAKDVSASIQVIEDRYRVGHYMLRVVADLGGRMEEEEAFFNVFGGDPLNLSLKMEKANITAFINVTAEKQYATVSNRIFAWVTMKGKPVEGAKLLAVAMGPNSTVTEVARTDSQGRATLDWSANVTENTTYIVVVQAMKPGHPIASTEAKIEVRVEKGG